MDTAPPGKASLRAIEQRIDTGVDSLVTLLTELVRAHPVYASPGIAEAQACLARELSALGAAIEWQEVDQRELEQSPLYLDVTSFGGIFADYRQVRRRNLIARFDFGAGPRLVLNGHVDVEFVTAPELWRKPNAWREGELREDRLNGRGTSDMLGGVACYVHTLKQCLPWLARGRGQLELQLVVDEEIGGNGTLWSLLRDTSKADLVLIAEPSDSLVCSQSAGFYQFRVVCHGAPVHMVFARPFDNAICSLAEVSRCLEALEEWLATCSRSSHRHVMYGVASGGTDAAVPAAMAELLVTIALPPTRSIEQVVARLQEMLRVRLGVQAGRLPSLEPYGVRFPGSSLSHMGWCEQIRRLGEARGTPLAVGAFPSPCDARLFEAFGIPSIVFGPGSLARAHGSDEYVTVPELTSYSKVLAATLLDFFAVDTDERPSEAWQ